MARKRPAARRSQARRPARPSPKRQSHPKPGSALARTDQAAPAQASRRAEPAGARPLARLEPVPVHTFPKR
ncbi:MAG TPA: hypothetical protein VIG99_27490, partial [Myxococcaceae bacterium]